MFLWQHPRVPWVCPHLGQPEQHVQVRRRMVAVVTHTKWQSGKSLLTGTFTRAGFSTSTGDSAAFPTVWRISWFLV